MSDAANSSHLGLIYTGGEGPRPEQCQAIVLEARSLSRPLIAAADSGLLLAEQAGLQSDWIIGDMDSLGVEKNRLKKYPGEKIIAFPPDKDFTDTELAFSLLREKGCNRIWIIGGGGGRIDHLFGLRSLFEREEPPERWITAAEDIRCIEAPLNTSSVPLCEAALTPAEIPSELIISQASAPLFPVSVFPLGSGPWEADSSGLRWPLAGLTWTRDFIAISNEAPDGGFTVTAKNGRFMVILPVLG